MSCLIKQPAANQPQLTIKIPLNIHTLMRNPNNIDTIIENFIKNQMHTFGKTIVARFDVRTMFSELRFSDNQENRGISERRYWSACSTPHS